MITGDASYIKKINRSLILKEIIKEGMISRADLSKITALTRATISVQVADLLEEGLVVEQQMEHNAVGRKPIMLSLNAAAGYAIGVDLDTRHISFLVTDLAGREVATTSVTLDTTEYQDILPILVQHIEMFKQQYTDSHYGIIGVTIAVHGLVSSNEELYYAPRLGWNNKKLRDDLHQATHLTVHLENNANLSAFAEKAFCHHHTNSLFVLTLYSGIGMGMIINDQFFRGYDGFAGEIGHMIVMPGGIQCECGNRGCWEKYASDAAILSLLSSKKQQAVVTIPEVGRWIADHDPDTLEVMEQFTDYLSIGLNNIINIFNPDTILLDSKLLRVYPEYMEKIQHKLVSRASLYQQLLLSSIGEKSVIFGACALAIQSFLSVPALNLSWTDREVISAQK